MIRMDEASGVEVSLAGPMRFARWQCPRCGGAGSGSVMLAAGSDGRDVRAQGIEHRRITGHGVIFTSGTMEFIGRQAGRGELPEAEL